MRTSRSPRAGGFTLIELLVVILIILIVSAATLPVVLPALNHRQVSEAARILQAALAGAHDTAIRANAPRGIRLVPDYAFGGQGAGALAASQIIPIEPAPDYFEGRVKKGIPQTDPNSPLYDPTVFNGITDPRIGMTEDKISNGLLNAPTSWFWNIRQGDKIRFGDSGRYYTIAGPMQVGVLDPTTGRVVNSERFINYGLPTSYQSLPNGTPFPVEFLFLVNGQDDNGNGYIDEEFDGIDNDGDGIIDPGFNGIDDNGNGVVDEWQELFLYRNPATGAISYPGTEYEKEAFVGSRFGGVFQDQLYTIVRRPVPTPGALAIGLPSDVVIDMTTWNAPFSVTSQGNPAPTLPERSRLPVDPITGFVDVMIAPNGQVLQAGPNSSAATPLPFYHFWVCEREDVFDPLWGITATRVPIANPNYFSNPSVPYLLPMPAGTPSYPSLGDKNLKGERRLVTVFTRTGQITTTSVENFSGNNTSLPYYAAQSGQREELK